MKILELLFPQNVKCLFCGKEDGGFGICDECVKSLPYIEGKTCIKCGAPINSGKVCYECKHSNHHFERVFSIFNYDGEIKQSIIKFKQAGSKYVGRPLATLVADYFDKLDIPFDTIIPMPIHPNRLASRGFNQSELLLEVVKSRYGRVYSNVLARVKDTPHQTGLAKANRQKNLDKAFKVIEKSKVKNKVVLVFDDIYTTGSTIDEVAKTLYKAGAVKVYGLCLAHAMFKNDKVVESNPSSLDLFDIYI